MPGRRRWSDLRQVIDDLPGFPRTTVADVMVVVADGAVAVGEVVDNHLVVVVVG